MEYLKQFMCVLVLAVLVRAIRANDAATTDPPTIEPNDDYEVKKPSTYAFSYETVNGQVRDENIQLDPDSPPSKMEVNIKGSFSFISADGYEYVTYYKADKKGFRPYVTAHKITTDKDKTN